MNNSKSITTTLSNGSVFTGNGWTTASQEGQEGPQGHGVIIYANGDKYDGDFNNGKKNGFGRFTTKSGSHCYSGYWLDDAKHGEGEIHVYCPTAYYSYQGEWCNDSMHGRGSHKDLETLCTRTGMWVNNKQHGYGTIAEPRTNCLLYAGNIDNNTIQGLGTMIYKSGASYQGDWRNGRRHGKGRFIYSDGLTEEVGYWVHDTFKGASLPEDVCLSESEGEDELASASASEDESEEEEL